MKEQLKDLIRELRRVKAEYDLKSITGHKTDIPVVEFNELIREFKLEYELEDGCLFSTFIPDQNIFIYLKSEPVKNRTLVIEDDCVFMNGKKPAA